MSKESHYLPDFCAAEVILKLVLVVEFMAIVFAIVTLDDIQHIYSRMGLISFFMLLIVFSSVTTLCLLKSTRLMSTSSKTTIVTLLVFNFYTLAFTVWVFTQAWFIALFDVEIKDLWFVALKFEIIALICVGVGLRYLFVQYESARRLKVQNKARLQALQARIRPHFLFNSMNTIASLVHDAPDQAEQATINLADLFRASLSEVELIPLQKEIELTKEYIEIEYLRLESRLSVKWVCIDDDVEVMIPPLTLQPLVENAIYHGIEPHTEGGEIVISSFLKDNKLCVRIKNPVLFEGEKVHGNQMALNNIKERLSIAFKGDSSLTIKEEGEVFIVEITLPLVQ
ncbi:MAG: histidine kinase [Gammaproteobacteria bacterium]|nr:histidine kinase [Gammaproteobacteria bacterium]